MSSSLFLASYSFCWLVSFANHAIHLFGPTVQLLRGYTFWKIGFFCILIYSTDPSGGVLLYSAVFIFGSQESELQYFTPIQKLTSLFYPLQLFVVYDRLYVLITKEFLVFSGSPCVRSHTFFQVDTALEDTKD